MSSHISHTTVVGFFDSRFTAEEAVSNLIREGIPQESISFLASDERGPRAPAIGPLHEVGEDSEAGTDATIGAIAGFAAGMILSVIPGIGTILAVGPITAAIGGLAVGAAAGGIIGVLKDHGVSHEEAEYYAEGIRRGGALVSVETTSDMHSNVTRLLQRSGAEDIKERAEQWRAAGWQGFDEEAPPHRVRRA